MDIQIIWQGPKVPTPEQVAICQAEISELGLGAAENLVFHEAWLGGETPDPDRVYAIIWGVKGSDTLTGEIHTREQADEAVLMFERERPTDGWI